MNAVLYLAELVDFDSIRESYRSFIAVDSQVAHIAKPIVDVLGQFAVIVLVHNYRIYQVIRSLVLLAGFSY